MASEPCTSSSPTPSASSPSSSSLPRHKAIMRLPNGITAEEVEEGLRKLILTSRRVPLLQPPHVYSPQHECNPGCDFFIHGIMFVCRLSNNIHFCSLSTCNRLQVDSSEETQVCEITACCYPLDYVMSIEMEASCGMHSQLPKPSEPDKTICKRNRDQTDPTFICKQRLDTFNTIRSILSTIKTSAGTPLLDALNTAEITETADRLWHMCVQTTEYKKQPYRYRHRYHVLVVLYGAIKGLHSGTSDVLIKQNDLLRQYLPPFKLIPKRVKDLDISTFTKTNKIFLACMRELFPPSK
jgi:hypothetical protein